MYQLSGRTDGPEWSLVNNSDTLNDYEGEIMNAVERIPNEL